MIWYKSTVLAWDVECHAKNHPVPWCSSHVWFIDSTNWWPLEDSEDIIYADIMVKISYDMERYNYCHNHSELLSYQVCYHIIIVLRHIAIYILPKSCSFHHQNQLVAHETVKRFPEEVPSLENLARPATPLRPPEDPSRQVCTRYSDSWTGGHGETPWLYKGIDHETKKHGWWGLYTSLLWCYCTWHLATRWAWSRYWCSGHWKSEARLWW